MKYFQFSLWCLPVSCHIAVILMSFNDKLAVLFSVPIRFVILLLLLVDCICFMLLEKCLCTFPWNKIIHSKNLISSF